MVSPIVYKNITLTQGYSKIRFILLVIYLSTVKSILFFYKKGSLKKFSQ